MMCMREHVHGLNACDGIFFVQELEVPGLGSRVAADVDDGRGLHFQYLSN